MQSVRENGCNIEHKEAKKIMFNIEKNSLKLRITDWRLWHYGKNLVH